MYQLTEILQKCDRQDAEFLVSTIDSYINLSDDKILKELIRYWREGKMPLHLAEKLETEIRYVGSSDIAYGFRKVFKDGHPGVDINEIIDDVASALPKKVHVKKFASIESRLEYLAKSVAIDKYEDLKPEEIKKMLIDAGLDQVNIEIIMKNVKENKALLFPLLYKFLGPEVTLELVKGAIFAIIGTIIGQETAKKIINEILLKIPSRFPFLGPFLWAISGAWLAFDLSAAASRKTIPIMLYLGIVCLRDGPVDGESFWNEKEEYK